MALEATMLESSHPSRKDHVARITLTEPTTFDTQTPSNSREAIGNAKRLLQFSDSSDESRCNSLSNNVGAAAQVVELHGLNTLLFGAIQALCQQPGHDPDASKELSQLAAMASKVPPQDTSTCDKYRQDLQDSCRRMASALPAAPGASRYLDACADPFTELAMRTPAQTVGLEGQPGRDSPFTASASKVIIPRNPSSSSRASSTLSLGSRRSSRVRTAPNPFEMANGSDAIAEGNEEEEVGVEEVVTPGGTCREVLVRQEFDYLVDNPEGLFRDPLPGKRTDPVPSMRSMPPELPDSKDSKQQLAGKAAPAGRKAASGQLTEADVAQAISDAGLEAQYLETPSSSGAAANPFATIRAVVTPAVPAARNSRLPQRDERPAACAQAAAARRASESPDAGTPGLGMAEAPDLNRISDPSPHSSASGSGFVHGGLPRAGRSSSKDARHGRAPSGEVLTLMSSSSRHAGGVTAPQGGAREAGGKPPGKLQDSAPQKAKSGCWCF